MPFGDQYDNTDFVPNIQTFWIDELSQFVLFGGAGDPTQELACALPLNYTTPSVPSHRILTITTCYLD